MSAIPMSLLQVTRMLRVSEFCFPSPCPCPIPLPVQRLSIFSVLGPERAKKLSIGVHGFADNRENRQPLDRERDRVRAAATSDVVFTTVSLTMTKLRR